MDQKAPDSFKSIKLMLSPEMLAVNGDIHLQNQLTVK